MKREKQTNAGRTAGFTILELIAVIGIVAIMGALVMGGFTGMMSSMSQQTARSSLERALNLARQEACNDGADTYLYVIDIDRYAIVRKAGTVTDRLGTGRSYVPDWAKDLRQQYQNELLSGAQWVTDRYADLADRVETWGLGNLSSGSAMTDEEYQAWAESTGGGYSGNLVFDMTENGYAKLAVPPTYNAQADAWLFAVKKKSDNDSTFSRLVHKGHEYGWVTHTVFSLPDGYVFRGSYNDDGTFKNNDLFVHFKPDGSPVGGSVDFIIEKPSENGVALGVTVTENGLVKPFDVSN